ncbi:hypothetical protein [Roseivivax halotolerans]|uniref:hypothetical protein n=1 Tax=Roseivivax halotolerans TaxID=93684 RepID=UPI001113917A|nr:hypothetical protein [Roseivivax halotolerans]
MANVKGRKRYVDACIKDVRKWGRYLGATARDEYREALIAHYGVIDLGPNRTLLAIFQHHFRVSGKRRAWEFEENPDQLICGIEEHALQRIAQRSGKKELLDFLDVLSPVWGWCDAATKARLHGRFYVPLLGGLVICSREVAPLRWSNPEDYERFGAPNPADFPSPTEKDYFVRVRTYLSWDTMRPNYRRLWERLAENETIEIAPRCPSLRNLSVAQADALKLMASEHPS